MKGVDKLRFQNVAAGRINEAMVRHGFTVLARVKCFLNSTPLYSIQLLLLHMHVMLPAQRNTLLRRKTEGPFFQWLLHPEDFIQFGIN